MFRKTWLLQDQENGGTGGSGSGGGDGGQGGQGGQAGSGAVAPADARKFVADFVEDPKSIETWDDKKVVDFHGRLTGAIDKVRPVNGKWPEKWRDELAAGDEKARARLERFAAPTDIFKSFRALEQRMSSGELKANVPFPEKGTDDEKKAWRTEQGVPESPEKYDLQLPKGFVIGDADKPFVEDFLKDAHAANLSPAAVNRAVNWFFSNRDKQLAAGKETRTKVEKETEDALRGEWGTDYRKNEGLIDGLLTETLADEDLRTDLATARKANPGFAKWMLGVALQLNPAGTVLPGAGGTQGQAVTDEIASLKKMMGDKNSEYWKGANAEKNQQRYRELTEWQSKQKKAA